VDQKIAKQVQVLERKLREVQADLKDTQDFMENVCGWMNMNEAIQAAEDRNDLVEG
jgi:type II secretory pathway component PulK